MASPTVWRIVRGSCGSFMEPPGSALHLYEINEIAPQRAPQNRVQAIMALDTDEEWVPESIRKRAAELIASHPPVRSELWERSVYGYFRGCYSPDGTDRNASRLLIVGQEEPLYPGHPLVESGEHKLSEYSSLNRGPVVTADDPRCTPEHHAAFLLVRRYFPDAEPRLDLIESGSPGGYGSRPCVKCGKSLQYEAKVDAFAEAITARRECPEGGEHEAAEPVPAS